MYIYIYMYICGQPGGRAGGTGGTGGTTGGAGSTGGRAGGTGGTGGRAAKRWAQEGPPQGNRQGNIITL